MTVTDSDRLWSALDKTNQYMETLEARVLRLETTRAPERPPRQVGDYLPDPVGDLGSKVRLSSGGPCPCGYQELEAHPVGWCKLGQGHALPDPLLDPLPAIRAILAEMWEPYGKPSPAQRLLIRIKAVVGDAAAAGASSTGGSAPAGGPRRDT